MSFRAHRAARAASRRRRFGATSSRLDPTHPSVVAAARRDGLDPAAWVLLHDIEQRWPA